MPKSTKKKNNCFKKKVKTPKVLPFFCFLLDFCSAFLSATPHLLVFFAKKE